METFVGCIFVFFLLRCQWGVGEGEECIPPTPHPPVPVTALDLSILSQKTLFWTTEDKVQKPSMTTWQRITSPWNWGTPKLPHHQPLSTFRPHQKLIITTNFVKLNESSSLQKYWHLTFLLICYNTVHFCYFLIICALCHFTLYKFPLRKIVLNSIKITIM